MKVKYTGELMNAGVHDANGQHEYIFEDGQEYDLPKAHVTELSEKGLKLEATEKEEKGKKEKVEK